MAQSVKRPKFLINLRSPTFFRGWVVHIDSVIEAKLSTDNLEIWIDATYIRFNYNPKTKKPFLETMTNNRKKFLKEELLSRYKKANWEIKYYNDDDGLDGPNMSGGDYLILKGKLN
jgi:hypothetical protein